MTRVLVVGAGVTGLTCAIRLLERGHDVAVVARDLPLETAAGTAAALWCPYRAEPSERLSRWAGTTYAVLSRLAADPRTGVRLRRGTVVLRGSAPPPWWAAHGAELAITADVPPGHRGGWTLAAPVVETPRYLAWLGGLVDDLGGTVTRMALPALPDRAEVVVNASGLGARLLAQDPTVVPVRGQVVHVEQVGLDRWWLDIAGPTYVVPRGHDVVVGGAAEVGSWDRRPDPVLAGELLERAALLVPELRRGRVLDHRVGVRSSRPAVRLEQVTTASGTRVVHCYGHSGAGVTVSWGCAEEVADLVGAA